MTDMINSIEALNRALADAMTDHPEVILLGEDLADEEGGGIVGVTKGLSGRFGDSRVRSTPISEQAIIGAGIGAALVGMRPVCEIMLMNFTTVAMDMITNHAAKLRFMSGGQTHVPMVIRTMTGTGLGNGGQHSDYLEAWFAHTPGMKVVSYSSPSEAYGLMRSAIDDDDPVLFIENIPGYFATGPAPLAGTRIPLGIANIARNGEDVTIISYSEMVNLALAAAAALAEQGISAEVIDLRTIAPYDRATVLTSVGKTGRAVIVHEAVRDFGVGAEIAADISEALHGKLAAPVRRLGGASCPVPFSKPLETAFAPRKEDIIEIIRGLF